jgi:hypothetical protein
MAMLAPREEMEGAQVRNRKRLGSSDLYCSKCRRKRLGRHANRVLSAVIIIFQAVIAHSITRQKELFSIFT